MREGLMIHMGISLVSSVGYIPGPTRSQDPPGKQIENQSAHQRPD